MGNCCSFLPSETGESSKPPSASSSRNRHDGPLYSSLPSNAKKHVVRNVYDGDTLTLKDETRVRIVGIDTPELKEKQPFAEEAKHYTKKHCPAKSEIYLVGDERDKYQRILADVYVWQGDGKYLCVNEGLVAEGLAVAYAVSLSRHPHNWDTLLRLQKQAREKKLGQWKIFQNPTVVKTANGAAYHVRSCHHLSNIKNLEEISAAKAMDRGLHPCRSCMG